MGKNFEMTQAIRPLKIETTRLLLRPMHAEDIDALLHIFADPIVMASFDAVPFDRQQMQQWLQRNLDHQAHFDYGLFAVILKANGLLIGDCGLEIMEVDGTIEAELGYDFRSDYWGQGLATEAALAVRDYAFQVLHLPRLVSLIRQRNLASQRVAEKVGLRRTTEITRYGQPYWVYALSRAEAGYQT
jgi:ribosomal-protein-alanine N-acetyltransferase